MAYLDDGRANGHLVDALPYYDTLLPEEKKVVNALIEEEVRWPPPAALCSAAAP